MFSTANIITFIVIFLVISAIAFGLAIWSNKKKQQDAAAVEARGDRLD